MGRAANILICDTSALYLHLHADGLGSIGAAHANALDNPLDSCASSASELGAFNAAHPLYGKPPVDVLVTRAEARRCTSRIKSHLCSYPLPAGSFCKLRDNLYVASPELVFARLGYGRSEAQIARIGTDLCARYFLHPRTGQILDRSNFATTPDRLRAYLESVPEMRSASKALRALRWVIANSGSPVETQMALLFRIPRQRGGFGLPFDMMNFDVPAGRLAKLAEQGLYCIDLVNREKSIGLEYDGKDSHPDASADKRRRNALLAMNWEIFAIDKHVLRDPDSTEKAARQVARKLGVRIRKPDGWARRYLKLRRDLGLPID